MKSTIIKPALRGEGSLAKNLGSVGIEEFTGSYQEPLRIAVYGDKGTGKTKLASTAPGPIGVLPLDAKTRQTIINDCQKEGKRLFFPKVNLVRVTNPLLTAQLKPWCKALDDGRKSGREMEGMSREITLSQPQPACCAIHYYRWHVNRVKSALMELVAHEEIKTVLIDSGTNLWDDVLFANHGRTDKIDPLERAADNREMQEILGICESKHLIITQKEAEIWKNNKPTGGVKPAGYGHLGYEVSAILRMSRHARSGDFYADIEMCQASAALHGDGGKHENTGLVNDMITFPEIAQLIYPESEITDWI